LQLTHQFREPVEVVATLPAITRAEYIVFSEQVLRTLLQRIRVNTGRGAVVEPLHSCRLGCIDHVMVDCEHLRTIRLAGVYELPTSKHTTQVATYVRGLCDGL